MNGKRARKLRKLSGCFLGKETDVKQQGFQNVGTKTIGILSHDGNHSSRDEEILEARTTEERYLYRMMKRVWSNDLTKPEIRLELKKDMKSIETD